MAFSAIMNAAASRGKDKKGTIHKIHELYDRNAESKPDTIEDVLKQQEEAMSWLSNKTIVPKTNSD